MDPLLIAQIIAFAWCGSTSVIEERIMELGVPYAAQTEETGEGLQVFWEENFAEWRVLDIRRMEGYDACESQTFTMPKAQ